MFEDQAGGTDRLRTYIAERLRDGLLEIEGSADGRVERYLTALLVAGVRSNPERDFDLGIVRLSAMLSAAEITQGANSFEQEREAHKRIGDAVMFWLGLFPERVRSRSTLNPIRIGKFSYRVAGSFDTGAHADEAQIFRTLSDRFEAYLFAVRTIRERWHPGLDAMN